MLFVKKSNFQTVIIIFVTMKGHTSKLFKYMLFDVQTEDKGEINTGLLLKNAFDTISIELLKSKSLY